MDTHSATRGRIVIPAALRRKYGIKEGTGLVIFDNGDSILLKPITEKYLRKLRGKGELKELTVEKRKAKFR